MRARRGEKNSNWRGDAVGYVAAHERLGPVRGKACGDCGQPAKNWSLSKSADPKSLRADSAGKNKGLLFSLDPAAYAPRCAKCHRVYDELARRGEEHHNAKLTEAQVLEIRRLIRIGGSRGYQKSIAEKFGVSPVTVSNIKTRKRWAHLSDAESLGVAGSNKKTDPRQAENVEAVCRRLNIPVAAVSDCLPQESQLRRNANASNCH